MNDELKALAVKAGVPDDRAYAYLRDAGGAGAAAR